MLKLAELAALRGHKDAVWEVDWSPDGLRIVTASDDHTVRVWDAEHGTELALIGIHQNGVNNAVWSPDGQRIATASRDRTARVWKADIELQALIAKARTRLFRELTADERKSAMLPN
jgi:WD40 repeat protein